MTELKREDDEHAAHMETIRKLKHDGLNLKVIPFADRDYFYCSLAVEQTFKAMPYVPHELIDTGLLELALDGGEQAINYIPKQWIDGALCEYAVNAYPRSIGHIPIEHIGSSLCRRAIELDPKTFKLIPIQFKTKEICTMGLKYWSDAQFYMPYHFLESITTARP